MFSGAGDPGTPSSAAPFASSGRTHKSRAAATGAPSWVRLGPSLARFKVVPMVTVGDGGSERPYMGGCCARCTPHSRKAYVGVEVTQLGIRNLLTVATADPDRAFLVRTFCYLSHAASREIPLPVERVGAASLLQSDAVQVALEQAVELQLPADLETDADAEPAIRRALVVRAEAILARIGAQLSQTALRLATWTLLHLLRCSLTAVQVHKGQLEVLRRAQAASAGTPLLLLPVRRSHLDAALVSFACVSYGVSPPLVAMPDRLRLAPVIGLLRRLGAFFVRRRQPGQEPDPLYDGVLQTYIKSVLQYGYNMMLFIEDNRSRTGRPRQPQAGLLSNVVTAYRQRLVDDVLLVPVGISYDRLLDGNFIGEQLGREAKHESAWSQLRSVWTALRRDHGAVRIDFAQPFKLSEFLVSFENGQPQMASPASSGSLYAAGGQEMRTALDVARHVLYDATHCCAVMSTQLVALLLLHRFRRGCTLSALCNAFSHSRDDMRKRSVDVGFTGNDADVVQQALALLGPGLMTKERIQLQGNRAAGEPASLRLRDTFVRPVTILPNVLELAY